MTDIAATPARRKVLNVGGNSKAIPIPAHYAGWDHLMLDIDPTGRPDIVCDARKLDTLAAEQFDAVYCSHNLEHYYRHEVPQVLNGFRHVLKPEGFAEILVPDLRGVMQALVQNNLDLEDTLYPSPAGPISALDVIYGFGVQIERTGQDFFAHKTGFTQKSLQLNLSRHFACVYSQSGNLEVRGLAFKNLPTDAQLRTFNLPPPSPPPA